MKHFLSPKRAFLALISTSLIVTAGCDTAGESRHERHAQQNADSAKPTAVSGGESFQTALAYDAAYDGILTFLKKRDCMIESSNRDTGQIMTAQQITGGWRQTGTRYIVTLIKEKDAAITVRVAVSEQHRFKALQIEPWGDATVNGPQSASLAQEIKAALL